MSRSFCFFSSDFLAHVSEQNSVFELTGFLQIRHCPSGFRFGYSELLYLAAHDLEQKCFLFFLYSDFCTFIAELQNEHDVLIFVT